MISSLLSAHFSSHCTMSYPISSFSLFFFSITRSVMDTGHLVEREKNNIQPDQCVSFISPISLVLTSFNEFQNHLYRFGRIPHSTFSLFFFMTYSINLLDTFFFFSSHPLSPHFPMYSCDPLPSSFFFTTFQLIISKNLRVLCYFRI